VNFQEAITKLVPTYLIALESLYVIAYAGNIHTSVRIRNEGDISSGKEERKCI
jgi:hypothetical protein